VDATVPQPRGPKLRPQQEDPAPTALFDRAILLRASLDALLKLDPRRLAHNPVIFVTEVVAGLTTIFGARNLLAGQPAAFALTIAVWLWLTVLFATFAEAVAEGRGRARAESLRRSRSETMAKRLVNPDDPAFWKPVAAPDLRRGDVVLVETGDLIPSDGEILRGIASVNESAITGESAPVIRESGGDRSAVTGGTQVISDWLVVRISADPGNTFIDRMIKLVEGAERRKTPNEIALDILLAGLTIIFLVAVVTLVGFAKYSGLQLTIPVLAALLVTLIPTTIGGLLSAIGIAGMDRLIRFNVIATSGRAVEAAGDVDALLLDKTGTITFGNRLPASLTASPGVPDSALAEAALMSSLADETPEGRAIVTFVGERFAFERASLAADANVVAFSANTRLSGIDQHGRSWRKGAVDSVLASLRIAQPPREFTATVERISRAGGTPLAVSADDRLLGVIELKDTVKPGIRERFAALRQMGIRTVMVTGDNRVTAATIAGEAGVDDFIAEATPQDKLGYIRAAQAEGRLVAMCGDGTNDAPALAQADVGIAIGAGTDIAIESADVVLVGERLSAVAEGVRISRISYRKTVQNLTLAFAFNGIGIPFAASGLLHPVWAMGAMVASVSTILLNSFGGRVLPSSRRGRSSQAARGALNGEAAEPGRQGEDPRWTRASSEARKTSARGSGQHRRAKRGDTRARRS